ncbi:hypothetical protein ABT390_35910 [Streptomyces aurantiacus]|uniref:Gram-positive cocci surface proteins LPxTG domain-containing protein n=1 Tax=Streptomyces aurantiacus JA 4570 TaxID=1286094 RepID=S3ZMJ0_9ACTN|nr:hypothetical protein [Streptomyces aurantiacus]EPH43994.1 hypothetical protein STRAU_2930 [Streptomyces aurantiacus JA 4570]
MTARRTLLTAATAGALLGALWFVPSAKATASPAPAGTLSQQAPDQAHGPASDTTPYLAGGAALLGLGAGFVLYSARREATEG